VSESRWKLNEAQKQTADRAGRGVRDALGVVKSLLFGSDDEAKDVLSHLAADAQEKLEARQAREGAIDVEGEPVPDRRAPPAPKAPSSPSSPPVGIPTVLVRCPCGSTQRLERRGRTDDALVAAFAEFGWRRPREGGWRCPGCASSRGGA
jgi:hypothetical protein